MTLDYINEIAFTKVVSGYKPGEVDDFIDEIAEAFKQLQQENESLKANIDTLVARIEEYREQENSIHTAFLNAQKYADNIINESKASAEKIVGEAQARANEINQEIDTSSQKRRQEFDENLARLDASSKEEAKRIVDDASLRAETVILAANDSVRSQQAVFDELKHEAHEFKTHLMRLYQSHIELINRIPEKPASEPVAAVKKAIESIDASPQEVPPGDAVQETESVAGQAADENFAEPQVIEPIELTYHEEETVGEPQLMQTEIEQTAEPVTEEPKPAFVSVPAEQRAEPQGGEQVLSSVAETVVDPSPKMKKGGFKIRIEEEDDTDETFTPASSLKFGNEYDLPDDTPENDEAAGFGFFKRKKK